MKTSLVMGIIGLSALLSAQEFRATITGTVTDPQGSTIPNAKIEVVNLATRVANEASTNESGVYIVPFLPIGDYSITVTAQGFKRSVRSSIELRVGDRINLDFRLELGAISEQVTVSAAAELLETTTASKGQVIDSAKVRDLPLLGRNPFMLAAVSAGVQYTAARQSRSNRPFDNGGMDSFAMNGGRQYSNEFLLDGVPDTNTETTGPTNLSFVPSPDATEEFKVQTNNYDAQYGRTGGGVVNVSLKSGTNRLHGALYHYFRNDKLNANAFESNLAGTKRSSFKWNQPGVQVDGPVFIPKVYDGRNRTFFMYSWEKIKSAIPLPQTYTVPTVEQRAADFSKTVQSNGTSPVLIYDPLTTALSGGSYLRQPFAGNIIPASRIDPVAAKMLDYIPKPTTAGNAQGFFNLIASPNTVNDEYDQHIVRVDQVLNDKHRFFSRYVRGNRHEVNSDAGFPHVSTPWYSHWRINQGGNFDLTSMLGPTLVSSFRAGYIRHQFAIQQYGEGFDPAQLGFPASVVTPLPRKFFPRIVLTDYTAFGPQRSTGSEFTFSDTWSFAETLNKSLGNHSLKFGGEYRVMFNNQDRPTSSFARFDFNKGFSQRDALRGDAASGNAFASLLLGYPASGTNDFNAALAYSNRYYVGFLQDDWRVTRTLTLNLGIRWDYESPISERYDRQNAGFDATAVSPLQVAGMKLTGGLLFTDSTNRLPYRRDLNNWQPRAGFAWQLRSKTVLRGGYGISFLPSFDTGNNNGYSVQTAYVASTDGGLTPSGKLNNPFPTGYLTPAGRSLGLSTLLGMGFSYANTNRVLPYVQQFSFGFQHELPFRVLVDASYVGSLTSKLQASKGINEIAASEFPRGNDLLTQVANPFAGLLPGSSINGATVPRQQLLRPFPQFVGLTEQRRSVGDATYHAFQLRIEKRMSHGVHFLGSYTFSKSLEAVGYLNAQDSWEQTARVLTSVDAPQRFVLSGGWDLPFFKGSSGITRQLLAGWTTSGIATFQAGQAIGAPGSAFSSGIDPKLADDVRNRNRWFNTCTLALNGARQSCASATEPVAFLVQAPFTLRTLSTMFPNIRNHRPPTYDFSIFKTFPITETLRLQFRAESFNMTNTPWFGNPNTTLGGASFGVVSPSQQNDPRNVQLALRLTF